MLFVRMETALNNYPPIIDPTLKIGEYNAKRRTPIITPIKTIIIGSIVLDKADTALSKSSS